MSFPDLDVIIARRGALSPTGAEGEVTHLPFDAARHRAAAAGADHLRAHLRAHPLQDGEPSAARAWPVLRGEGPPHAAACDG